MEIYIQEIQATSFFTSLPSETRRRIVGLSLIFPEVLQKCIEWKAAKIPSSAWHSRQSWILLTWWPWLSFLLQTSTFLNGEPNVHHVCMPAQVLLALLTVALMWGWDRVAGCLGLGWGALLRAGELISATRSQLLLPSDVFFSANFCLISILEPKTRFTAARHAL